MITSNRIVGNASKPARRASDYAIKTGASGQFRQKRMVFSVLAIGAAISCSANGVLAEGAFKRLSAAEIRKTLIGKVVTDGFHWSDQFKANGSLESIMHGRIQKGRWKVRGNGSVHELCDRQGQRRRVLSGLAASSADRIQAG